MVETLCGCLDDTYGLHIMDYAHGYIYSYPIAGGLSRKAHAHNGYPIIIVIYVKDAYSLLRWYVFLPFCLWMPILSFGGMCFCPFVYGIDSPICVHLYLNAKLNYAHIEGESFS